METSVRATASSLKSVRALWTSLLDHEREALQADIVLAAVNLGARECAAGQREVKLECKVNVAEWGERAGAPSPLCAPSVCGYDRLQRCIRGGHLWRCLAFHCLANVFDVLQESMLIRMASMEHQTCAGRRCRGWRLCSHCRWPCTPGYTSHRPTAAQRANGGVVHQHGPRSDRGSQQEVAHDT
jgi:hypothetical protein